MLGFGLGNRDKPEAPQLNAVFVCETGLLRAENQDNVLVSVGRGVFCVADGVGGGAEGAKASATVCHELKMMLHVAGDDFVDRLSAVRTSLVDANAVIHDYAHERGYEQMGTTAVVLVFDLQDCTRAAVVHVGDSRAYRVRHGLCERITRDHRALGDNSLTRAIGAFPTVTCDVDEIDVAHGDRFLVCSDGVYGVVSDGRIATFVGGGTIDSAAERLAAEVVRKGAPDNYSFVLVSA